MAKHTPGPWAWGGEPGRSELSAAGGRKVIDYAGYEGMWLAAYNADRDAANAALIAAAPDLLAAAKGARLWLAALAMTESVNGLEHQLAQLDGAIAKAEGK